MRYPPAHLIPPTEVVVDLQQLHATSSPHLLFSFGFVAVFFSCHPQFPPYHAVQTHIAHRLPLLLQLDEDVQTGSHRLLPEQDGVFLAGDFPIQDSHFHTLVLLKLILIIYHKSSIKCPISIKPPSLISPLSWKVK